MMLVGYLLTGNAVCGYRERERDLLSEYELRWEDGVWRWKKIGNRLLLSLSKVSEQLRGGRAGVTVHKGAGAGLRTGRFNSQSGLWRSKKL
jgi:hypothetical protein